MTPTNRHSAHSKLNNSSLQELALAYVARYATTRAKLRAYLVRKLRERGWSEDQDPDLDRVTDSFARIGYIDDAAYALARSRTLIARGYGERRLADKLRSDGVGQADRAEAEANADQASLEAALNFAKRRRLGPFAPAAVDRSEREKWIAAMVRAGHPFALARAISALPPGAELDADALGDLASRPKINLD